jgi:hypothetical protein
MRVALYATAGMNLSAGIAFFTHPASLLETLGFPVPGHPLYVMTVGIFVLLFALGYFSLAALNRGDRFFIALSALGKLSFVSLVLALWALGSLPARAPAMAAGDLLFGGLFVAYLLGND